MGYARLLGITVLPHPDLYGFNLALGRGSSTTPPQHVSHAAVSYSATHRAAAAAAPAPLLAAQHLQLVKSQQPGQQLHDHVLVQPAPVCLKVGASLICDSMLGMATAVMASAATLAPRRQ